MKLLHVIATPREKSACNTVKISNALIHGLRARYPDLGVEELNLFEGDSPAFSAANVATKYKLMSGRPFDKRDTATWCHVERTIQQFVSADIHVITCPMWNLSIPYALKYYIDTIVQPGYLFRYDERGEIVPLAVGKKMVCVTSRGADYSEGSPLKAYDFQEPYLRAIFGLVGIYDMHFINAQPMDAGPELREVATTAAIGSARELAAGHEWRAVQEELHAVAS